MKIKSRHVLGKKNENLLRMLGILSTKVTENPTKSNLSNKDIEIAHVKGLGEGVGTSQFCGVAQ